MPGTELRQRGTSEMQEGKGGCRIKRVVWTLGPDEDRNSGGRLIDLDAEEPDPRDLMIPDYTTGWGVEPLEHPVYKTQPVERRRFRKALRIIVNEQPSRQTPMQLRGRPSAAAKAQAHATGTDTSVADDASVADVYTRCMAKVASR